MKPTVLVLCLIFLALAVVSVSASHHKKHRTNNIKSEEYFTTFDPTEGDNGDGGDTEWPAVDRIRNFNLPNVFGPGRVESARSESAPAKHHGKSAHGTHSH